MQRHEKPQVLIAEYGISPAEVSSSTWLSDNSLYHGKGAKQVIYYGSYSQAWRGRERRQGILPTAPAEEDSASSMKDRSSCFRRRKQLWAVLLKKVWDVNVLKCPKCGGQMKVISFTEQPFVIRHILKHLDLWEDQRPPPKPLEMVCEPEADYIPWQDNVPEIEVGQ